MAFKSSKTKVFILVLFVFFTLSLLGLSCSKTTSNVAPSVSIETNTIDMVNFEFVPDSIKVPVGTTVTWRNKDGEIHTIISDTNLFESEPIPSGGDYSYTCTEAGTFTYYCVNHPYMKGKITVK